MKECTFKPQRVTAHSTVVLAIPQTQTTSQVSSDVHDSRNAAASVVSQSTTGGNKRFEHLYELSKQSQAKARTDKTKEDYEYERNKDELTFKPKMLTKAGHSSANKKADVKPNE